ncbi:hypothetical protein BIT28_10070 [Photobacterium proteolyticum]|jgi:uncharacterized protein YejL (UPF0352 family)|uniref:UPF0352 protein BIT28_10070 n=3 Tax=Photobacterium TaxID=657 RepID=A0A1Q9GL27_9GAMM|nr:MULTISPECIES: YejL family protein [Photobacterium]MCG7586584.1 YejL family protein [Photobacterium sp. OFAV2-7]NBI51502.1 DUF1414 domain-containing protein [Photobacterium alginatilyticum]OLQ75268.1 hypothetical protein BIT28_10070 [Photobacterium proteolyticum]RWX56702.1 DUF1414 domain-containing protein [Photobacterium chitinilyticum]
MPITSKYTNKKVEQIIDDVFDVLEKHDASAELALMIVGNIATNVINADVPASQRKAIAEKFSQALLSSIKED